MAAASTRSGSSGIFWMNGGRDEDLSFNSGPGCPRNTGRKGTNIQSRQNVDQKNKVSLKKGVKKQCHFQDIRHTFDSKENMSFHSNADVPTEHTSLAQVIAESSRVQNQVCLKDLCPEDKRRIANLIEELARVSEEKEESMQRLKDEHENFERKIHQLEKHNVVIAQERESLQQQYRECQELLALYQQYLSEQQVKLNQSISQLTLAAAHGKVLTSEEAPSRATGRASAPLFDGSYLSYAAPEGHRPEVHKSGSGRMRAQQAFSRPPSSDSEYSLRNEQISRQTIQKLGCRESRATYPHRCEQYQEFCQDSGYGTQRRDFEGHSLERSYRNTFNHHECERLQNGNSRGLETKGSLTSPLLGHEDWEEKRHQLLLQKMQLEMEREKLQARLVEQEKRLDRQNQKLSQSQLDYKRFQESTQSELGTSNMKNENPQSEGIPHQAPPTSVCEDAAVHSAQQSMHEKCLQSAPPLDNIIHTCAAAPMRSKRDVATSPAKSPTTLTKSTSSHATEGSVNCRVDYSVVELLDTFSPLSAASQRKPSSRRINTSQSRPALTTPKPVHRSLLTPAGRHLPSRQDLEESQILEDIFFIC